MSWDDLSAVIRAEAPELAEQLERAIQMQMAGIRLTIPSKPKATQGRINTELQKSGYSIYAAAESLGVHPTTVYRRLHRKPIR